MISTRGRRCAPRSDTAWSAAKRWRRRAFEGGKGRIARSDREQGANGGEVRLQLPHAPHPLLDLSNDVRLAVKLIDLKVLPQQLNERQKRTGLAKGDAVALPPGHG